MKPIHQKFITRILATTILFSGFGSLVACSTLSSIWDKIQFSKDQNDFGERHIPQGNMQYMAQATPMGGNYMPPQELPPTMSPYNAGGMQPPPAGAPSMPNYEQAMSAGSGDANPMPPMAPYNPAPQNGKPWVPPAPLPMAGSDSGGQMPPMAPYNPAPQNVKPWVPPAPLPMAGSDSGGQMPPMAPYNPVPQNGKPWVPPAPLPMAGNNIGDQPPAYSPMPTRHAVVDGVPPMPPMPDYNQIMKSSGNNDAMPLPNPSIPTRHPSDSGLPPMSPIANNSQAMMDASPSMPMKAPKDITKLPPVPPLPPMPSYQQVTKGQSSADAMPDSYPPLPMKASQDIAKVPPVPAMPPMPSYQQVTKGQSSADAMPDSYPPLPTKLPEKNIAKLPPMPSSSSSSWHNPDSTQPLLPPLPTTSVKMVDAREDGVPPVMPPVPEEKPSLISSFKKLFKFKKDTVDQKAQEASSYDNMPPAVPKEGIVKGYPDLSTVPPKPVRFNERPEMQQEMNDLIKQQKQVESTEMPLPPIPPLPVKSASSPTIPLPPMVAAPVTPMADVKKVPPAPVKLVSPTLAAPSLTALPKKVVAEKAVVAVQAPSLSSSPTIYPKAKDGRSYLRHHEKSSESNMIESYELHGDGKGNDSISPDQLRHHSSSTEDSNAN